MLWRTPSMAAAAFFAKILKTRARNPEQTQHKIFNGFCASTIFFCEALGFPSTQCREDCIHICRLQYTHCFPTLPEPLEPGIADPVLVPFHGKSVTLLLPLGATSSAHTSRGSCWFMQSSLLLSNLVFNIFTYSKQLQTAGCTCCVSGFL